MMYDRLVGWWIIFYIMLRCYGWDQDIVCVGIIRICMVIGICLEEDILTVL